MTPELDLEQAADMEGIRAVQSAAFGREDEADLVDALRAGGWGEISLVTRLAEEIVGHVLFSRLEAPVRALALAPVAVRPDRQGRGVGGALIREGLRRATAERWDAVFVLGEPAYYQRFGFSREAAQGFDCAYAGDCFMAVILRPDAIVTGPIGYPPPFTAIE